MKMILKTVDFSVGDMRSIGKGNTDHFSDTSDFSVWGGKVFLLTNA
jgi:hypothetical protein